MLDISVFQVPDLTRSAQVSGDGTISLPLIGPVQAVGQTPRQLEDELKTRLRARYLRSPQVTVNVKEFNSQKFTVEGAVSHPGVFPMSGGQATLLRAVASAGGFDRVADPSNIVIFRTIDNQRVAARFDIGPIRTGAAPDPEVQSGDVIVVDSSAMRTALRDVLQLLPAVGTFMVLTTVL